MHRVKIGKVTQHNLGAEPAQCLGTFIFAPDQGANLVSLLQEHRGQFEVNRLNVAGRPVTKIDRPFGDSSAM